MLRWVSREADKITTLYACLGSLLVYSRAECIQNARELAEGSEQAGDIVLHVTKEDKFLCASVP